MLKTAKPVKKITKWRPTLFSRHPSHAPFRTQLPLMPCRAVIRMGSTTEVSDSRIQINTVQAIKNSSNKMLMKECFYKAGIRTADWYLAAEGSKGLIQKLHENENNNVIIPLDVLPYPIIAKSKFGSRNTGNYKLDTKEELDTWMNGKKLSDYIFERFYSYSREYRLHITEDGCFYTCRKMLKSDTDDKDKWHRHDSNCVWILESNPSFDKPCNWEDIVKDCVNALKSLGLDIGCMDLKIQSSKDSKGKDRINPEWIIIESGSAPSMGLVTLEKYLEELPKLILKKYEIIKK